MFKNKSDPISNLSWEADIVQNERRSRITAWRVAAVAIFTVFVMAVAIALMMPLKRIVPYVVMVDKLTNEAQVINTGKEYVSSSVMSDKHWVQSFLLSRERYIYKLIQADYDGVKLFASDKVWAAYRPLFEGGNALDIRLKDDVEIIPRVLSITLTGTGLATVRYELTTKDYRVTTLPTVQRRIATLRYEYQTKNLSIENESIANPFGFTITGYQTDPEMFNSPAVNSIPTISQ